MVYTFPDHFNPNIMGLTMMALLLIGSIVSNSKCKFLHNDDHSSVILALPRDSCKDIDVFGSSTLAPVEESVLRGMSEEQMKNIRDMGYVLYFGAIFIFIALIINLFLKIDTKKVIKETEECADKVFYEWYSAVYLLLRSSHHYNRRLKTSIRSGLQHHQRYVEEAKRYIMSRIISYVIYSTVVYFTTNIHKINIELYETSNNVWESHENYTSFSYSDIHCFRNHYQIVQNYFMYLYIVMIFGYFAHLSDIYYLSECYVRYIIDWVSVRGSHPKPISEVFYNVKEEAEPVDEERVVHIDECYFLVPNFYEYLLIDMVKASGKKHYVQYIATNVYRAR